MSTAGQPQAARLARWVETVIKSLCGTAMFVWVFSLLPAEGNARWLLFASGFIAVVALMLLWRKLVLWHSQLEIELQTVIATAEGKMTATPRPGCRRTGIGICT